MLCQITRFQTGLVVGALSTTPSLHSSACPLPRAPATPCQSLLRGFQGLGRISALCNVPGWGGSPWGGTWPAGTTQPCHRGAGLSWQAPGNGGGDRSAMYLAGNVLCLLPEWLLPAAPWQHQGCSVREKNQPHQKHSLPDRLQTAVVITRKSLGPSTTASNFWF